MPSRRLVVARSGLRRSPSRTALPASPASSPPSASRRHRRAVQLRQQREWDPRRHAPGPGVGLDLVADRRQWRGHGTSGTGRGGRGGTRRLGRAGPTEGRRADGGVLAAAGDVRRELSGRADRCNHADGLCLSGVRERIGLAAGARAPRADLPLQPHPDATVVVEADCPVGRDCRQREPARCG